MNTNENGAVRTFGNIKVQSHEEMLNEPVAATRDIVDGMLTPGVSLLGGAPKSGKSLMAMQLAGAIACEQPFIGRQTFAGDVLYIDLEMSLSTRKNRSARLIDGPNKRHLVSWVDGRDNNGGHKRVLPHLGSGLEDWLDLEISRRGYRLVVIDTMVRVQPEHTSGSSRYQQDARLLEGLVAMANQYPQTAVLLVTHARETKAATAFDALYGSRGLTASVNCGLLLEPVAGHFPGTAGRSHELRLQGRDIADQQVGLRRLDDLRFRMDDEVYISDTEHLRDNIIEVLADAEGPLAGHEVAHRCGKNAQSVRRTLLRMAQAGQLYKRNSMYSVPVLGESEEDTDD